MTKSALARGCDEVHLTMREIEVLRLAAAGLVDRRIACVLHISLRTVEFHLARMMERTGAKNRTELVARGYAAGILVPSEWPPTWSGSRCSGIQVPCGGPYATGAPTARAEHVISTVTSGSGV
jgi:DNA-binding CsgD family transcriptional regulator